MTTIATSLERCTLITMHERAPHTVPQAVRLTGQTMRVFGNARSMGWEQRSVHRWLSFVGL